MNFSDLPETTFQRPLLMAPFFSQRPWGGQSLATTLGKNLPKDSTIGESWELSDHPAGRSTVAPGSPAEGATFGELVRTFPKEMIGRDQAPDTYPLLVKYIDAAGDLSVQVHPDDQWCRDNNHPDRGKSESWYVIAAQPDTAIVYGFAPGIDEAAARRALDDKTFTDTLEKKPIVVGDFLSVPPGTVHAMLTGALICEIQQSSNTTFRLYDWDRQPARELHIDESFQISQFDSKDLPPFQHHGQIDNTAFAPNKKELVANDFFAVTLHEVPARQTAPNPGLVYITGAILNVVAGNGLLKGDDWKVELKLGQTWYLPAAMSDATLIAGKNGLRVLRSISNEL